MSEEAMSIQHTSKLEEKFSLIRKSKSQFVGKHPLEPFMEGGRGSYGGDFVAQTLLVAWESIEDKEFHPHSLHSYFLKAGLSESPMRYEVENTSDGRNFCSRLVRCYQLHSGQLCFMLMASFIKDNNIVSRKQKFANLSEEQKVHERTSVPFEFLREPIDLFDKYADKIDELTQFEHTNNNITHAIPLETFAVQEGEENLDPGSKQFGLFAKVNDDLRNAKDKLKASVIDLAFLTDSFFLGTMTRAVGIPLTHKNSNNFFRVSLDHAIYFHDTDFDPTQWMFLDYRFHRMSNDRILVTALFFTLEKKLVATVSQEAIAFMPMRVVKHSKAGTYKL